MQANCFIDSLFSNINNSISAPALGAGDRGFESRYPDKKKGNLSNTMSCLFSFIVFSLKKSPLKRLSKTPKRLLSNASAFKVKRPCVLPKT